MKLNKLLPGAKTKGKIEFTDKKIITGRARLSYAHLFDKQEYKGKSSWSCQLLFDKDEDLSEMIVAAQNAAIEEWGADPKSWPAKKKKVKGVVKSISVVRSPFRDGDVERPDKEEYEGKIFIGASCTKRAPGVINLKGADLSEGEIKSGDYVRASLVASAYEVDGSFGVKFTLLNVQLLKKGEALGGGRNAAEDFADAEEYEDEEENDEEESDEESEDEDESEEDEDSDEDDSDDEDEDEDEAPRKKASKKAAKKTRR